MQKIFLNFENLAKLYQGIDFYQKMEFGMCWQKMHNR
jgi:hypothetical protein